MKGEVARVGGRLAVGALLAMGAASGRAAGETITAAPPAVEVRADRSDGLYRTNDVSFIDPLCAATGHFAIYNRMTCPKLILHNPGSGHNVTLLDPENDRRRIEAFKREHAGKPKAQP